MLKQSLCAMTIISAMTGMAQADDYTYFAGGLQVGGITSKSDFDKLVHQNRSDQSKTTMGGFYLRGGYGFENNLFIDARLNGMGNSQRSSGDSLLGLGYHFPINPNTDMYALIGASGHAISTNFDWDKKRDKSWGSATGEIGVKSHITDKIGMNVAYRYAEYDSRGFNEARIGADYALTPNLAAEIGYTYHNWKVDDQIGEIGLRYTF
ncbi:porin family protein [Hafnia alvei]|uniref:outer membrane beta-barrel protein n=1 Tax=Hafnia alvei TaxID=569 RepID=UPI00103548C5|nr:outer membrane beta-barrel protein [Hafnia alvei]TBM18286.1 porin family protein [Hafnia alvei]